MDFYSCFSTTSWLQYIIIKRYVSCTETFTLLDGLLSILCFCYSVLQVPRWPFFLHIPEIVKLKICSLCFGRAGWGVWNSSLKNQDGTFQLQKHTFPMTSMCSQAEHISCISFFFLFFFVRRLGAQKYTYAARHQHAHSYSTKATLALIMSFFPQQWQGIFEITQVDDKSAVGKEATGPTGV